ncbi:MAG: hypothetical protein IPF69_00560 [Chitinophagaceae bacterium]|nr:hypothetical protein [Chitinophagaceae bacterium]
MPKKLSLPLLGQGGRVQLAALMLTTENFDKAKQKFKALYNQLNNLSGGNEKKNFRLKGKYEVPAAEKKSLPVLFSQ